MGFRTVADVARAPKWEFIDLVSLARRHVPFLHAAYIWDQARKQMGYPDDWAAPSGEITVGEFLPSLDPRFATYVDGFDGLVFHEWRTVKHIADTLEEDFVLGSGIPEEDARTIWKAARRAVAVAAGRRV